MYIHVNGKNIDITEAIKAYVKEKIGKVATHYDQIQGIEVMLSVIKNPAAAGKHIAEVICKVSGGNIHVEEAADSMYASIDLLADKLSRQVKKYKDKISTAKDKTASIRKDAEDIEEEVEELVEEVE